MPDYLKNIGKRFGPGFVTGASDDDPAGIATYTQVGAQFGFGLIWTALLSLPFMIAVQETVARISMVSGRGITSLVRRQYPRWVLWLFVSLIVVANTINIGADVGAMASAMQLLIPGAPFAALAVSFTLLILLLEVFITYASYVRVLKWLALSLLAYAVTMIFVTNDWGTLVRSAFFPSSLPSLAESRDYLLGLLAILGTTISPYLMIWESNEEIEEEIAEGRTTVHARRGATKAELRDMRSDVVTGMSFSNVIMLCIIATAASVFFRHGLFDIATAADAARALEPLAGRFSALIFTVGIVGTGLVAVPILSASASYALSEAFEWQEGLSKKIHEARGFYAIITASMFLGLLINFIGINPIKALFWSAVFNGLVTPVLIIILLLLANNKKIMGRHTNGLFANVLLGFTFVVMTAASCLIFIL